MIRKINLFIFITCLVISTSGIAQGNNSLMITGTVGAEKAAAKDIKIAVIEITSEKNDTIRITNPKTGSNPSVGNYSIELKLDRLYKVVFKGDEFQEIRYLDISTKIDNPNKYKNYSVSDLYVPIWMGDNGTKKIGNILFDKNKNDFILNKTEKNNAIKDVIKDVVIGMFQELANRNTEKIKDYCEPDIEIFEDGEVWTLDTLVNKISQNKAPDFKRVNSFQFLSVTIDQSAAWTTYNNIAEVTKNGEHFRIEWLETAILIRKNNRWRIKVLHSTLLKREKL